MLIVRAGGPTVRALQRRAVEGEVGRGRELHAAAGAAPVPGDGGQARDGAHGHSATGVTLQSVVHADERRACAAVPLAERDDGLCVGSPVTAEARSGVHSAARSRSSA